MKAKKYWTAVLLLVVCLGLLTLAPASDTDEWFTKEEQRPLVGLKGVHVSAVLVSGVLGMETYGLTKDQLVTDAELRLRRNGIKVLPLSELSQGQPSLAIRVTHIANEQGLCAYKCDVVLQDLALLTRNPRVQRYCHSWPYGLLISNMAIVSSERFEHSVRKVVGKEVDLFCSDYLAANAN